MNNEIQSLSRELLSLRKAYLKSHCAQCTMMRNYIIVQFESIQRKVEGFDHLLVSKNPIGLQDLKASVAVLGMYLYV